MMTAVMTKTSDELVQEAHAQIENVTPQQAYDEISVGQAIALDIREPVEWEHHVKGAVQVPRGLLEFAADPTRTSPISRAVSAPGGRPAFRPSSITRIFRPGRRKGRRETTASPVALVPGPMDTRASPASP